MSQRSERFRTALQDLEGSRDPSMMEPLFTDEAELRRPELDHDRGAAGDVRAFWKAYLDQFSEIDTEFDTVEESGDLAVLEWTSRGRLAAGRTIDYRGVSVLRFEGDQVARFSTFFDTAAFLEPVS